VVNSYTMAQETLISLLSDKSYKVIALSGKWGSGKTHLWSETYTKLNRNDSSVGAPIYFSIFGAKSINELKLRLLQCATLNKDNKYKEFIGAGGSLLKGLAGKFISGVSVEELVLLGLPKLLDNRLVVIDDIERKHKNFDIDEILGFINEYSESYNTRFLLLLNSDNLEDETIWRKLHEKVIDIELVLKPNSEETYDVAAGNSELMYGSRAKSAVSILGITNIRIIRRILRVLSVLISAYGELDDYVLDSIVGSTTLLTAIHYHGLSSNITIEYVQQYNSFNNAFSREQRTPEELDWDDILTKLKISSADSYEEIVITYLRSGIVDRSRLDEVIRQYKEQSERQSIYINFRNLFESYSWDPEFRFDINADSVRTLRTNAHLLSASDVSSLCKLFAECGHPSEADNLIYSWIDRNEAIIESGASEHFSSEGFSHPALAALDARIRNNRFPALTLAEAFHRIRQNNGWGDRENVCLSESTQQSYEEVIRGLRGRALADFLSENFSILRIANPSAEFLHALANFKSACKQIIDTNPNSRLSQILTRTFNSHNVTLDN